MNAWLIVGGLLLSVVTGIVCNVIGYDHGQAAANAAHDHAAVDALQSTLSQANAALDQSTVASKTMRNALTQLEQTGRTSTKELKDALAKNHADPVLCRFDADSMRIIEAARQRAAQAAASGVLGTVPGTDRGDR